LPEMKPQFGRRRHPKSRETHRGAGVVWTKNCVAQIFQPALPPRLLPQELQGHDPLDIMLQPAVRDDLPGPAPYRLPGSLLFPVRSREYLRRSYRKRCAPNRVESLLPLDKGANGDALTIQSNPMSSVPLPQDCAQRSRDMPHDLATRLGCTHLSTPPLV